MFVRSIKTSCGCWNLASNDSVNIAGRGNIDMTVTDGTKNRKITLEDTLFAPDVRMNLLSVSKITDHNHEVIVLRKIELLYKIIVVKSK